MKAQSPIQSSNRLAGRQDRLRQALRQDNSINRDLDRLEKAANKEIRKTFPWFRYKPGEVANALREDLWEVVTTRNWREEFERTRDHLRDAAKHIREAVQLVARAAKRCPTIASIPPIIQESAPEVEAKFQRITSLPPEKAVPAALQLLQEKPMQAAVAPGFLKAMLVYSAICQDEADKLDRILKARDKRYDRLAPILKLIHDVQSSTGKPYDLVVARLLSDAFYLAHKRRLFTVDGIRKLRNRHLPR